MNKRRHEKCEREDNGWSSGRNRDVTVRYGDEVLETQRENTL